MSTLPVAVPPLGVAGYHYIQLTGDSGSGATLGSFEERNSGIRPTLNYATQVGGHATILSLRHYWEYESTPSPQRA